MSHFKENTGEFSGEFCWPPNNRLSTGTKIVKRNQKHLVDIVSLLLIFLCTDIQLKQRNFSAWLNTLCTLLFSFQQKKKAACTEFPRDWNFKAGSKYHNK